MNFIRNIYTLLLRKKVATPTVVAPVITSVATASARVGVAFSYQIAGTNAPTRFTASGLPTGLSLNTATGAITGTPISAGTSFVILTASNGGGTSSSSLTITIAGAQQPAPVITSGSTATATAGSTFSYQIAAANAPASFGATGLPSGLSVNTGTGLVSGTPTTTGNMAFIVSATNAAGTGTRTVSITILPQAPVITSALNATASEGAAFSYQIAASHSPTSYAATGLPAGLSINTSTGAITGTATSPGTNSVAITATNAGGTGAATLSLVVSAPSGPYTTNEAETFWDDVVDGSNIGQAAGGPGMTYGQVGVGRWYGSTARSYIIPIKLPYLAPGQTITSAGLTLDYLGLSGVPTYNVDLYGLGRTSTSATPVPIAADAYAGTNDTANTLIAQSIVTPGTAAGTITVTNAALKAWLIAQYAACAAAGTPDTSDRYVFLRLNTQGTDSDGKCYLFGCGGSQSRSSIPRLSITSSGVLNAATNRLMFSFTLPDAAFTSAGVFDASGNLVRTLWSGVPFAAGLSHAAWDGNADSGAAAPSGTYTVRVMYHNFAPVWEGVIGNTSSENSGANVWRGYSFPVDVACDPSGGGKSYVAMDYNEAEPIFAAFSLSSPQAMLNPSIYNASPYETVSYVATDGNLVYLAKGAGGYNGKSLTYVWAVDSAMVNDHTFSNGTTVTNAQGSQLANSVVDFDNTLVTTFPSNPAPGDSIKFGNTLYTFETALTAADQVLIGSSLAATLSNLEAAINGGSGAGATYGAGTGINGVVTATISGTTLVTTGQGNYVFAASNGAVQFTLPNPATGLAVQQSGNWLFVAHGSLNVVRVFNKTTGAAASSPSFSVTTPGRVACDNAGNLYVISGSTVLKYAINGTTGAATLIYTITGLTQPLSLAVQPSNTYLAVVDGGSSMQVKFFGTSNGAAAFSYGTAGGVPVNGPNLNNSTFWFDNTPQSSISFAPDGSFWVIDFINQRLMHFGLSGTNVSYIEQITYVGVSYACCVDLNNPSRVFNQWFEYAVDYTKTLDNGVNGSWTLVRNWAGCINLTTYSIGLGVGPRSIMQLSNGRTYCFIYNTPSSRFDCFEIEAAALRSTGYSVSGGSTPIIQQDGSLVIVHPTASGGTFAPTRQALTGFDSSGNPQWSATKTNLCSVLLAGSNPQYGKGGIGFNEQFKASTSGLLPLYDTVGDVGYHLGGIDPTTNAFRWQAMPTCPGTFSYTGKFPNDGKFDVGNGAHYLGTATMIVGRYFVVGYRGENWKNTQAPMFYVFRDDGLYVGVFGTLGVFVQNNLSVAGFAGNPLAPIAVVANGNTYLYVNDESNHAGTHRWNLEGLTTSDLVGTGSLGQVVQLN